MAVGQPGINGFRPALRANGLTVPGLGRVQATVRDTGGQVYNILAYGLRGDNNHDNTPPLQDLIARVHAAGGGEIFFPAGAYVFRSVNPTDTGCHIYLNGTSNIRFRGTGDGSILGAISTDKDFFRLTNSAADIQMESLQLTRIPGAVDGGAGIRFYNSVVCPRFTATNLYINSQYDGVLADTSRPQNSYWNGCRFWNNVSRGVWLKMNNDEHFANCEFFYNGTDGVRIGDPTTPTRSDGAVYFTNCAIYAAGQDGLHVQGTATEPCWNVFWDGGIIDSSIAQGVTIIYGTNCRIHTRVSYNSGYGVYIFNSHEIHLTGLEVADSGASGLLIQGPSSHIMGSGVTTLSNGRGVGTYYGVRIVDDVTYLSLFAGSSGNAQNGGIGAPTLDRQTQDGGISIEGPSPTQTPDNIELDGWSFPGMAAGSKFVTSGTLGANITLREANTSNMLDLLGTAQSTRGRNQTLDPGYAALIVEQYEIDAGTYLEIGAGATLEIS
jgi:hypothetical protein